ncbi:MAG TPA: hypothetical protein VNL13_06550 [Sulfolobales archaeon]|nr:hypothetical protein [Sulfolobales archaeon]
MTESLGILARTNSLWFRRSAALFLAMATVINTLLVIEIPKGFSAYAYSVVSSIAISVLTLSGLKNSLESFFRALLYCGGGRVSRAIVLLYTSIIASLPSYPVSALLNAPYISIIVFMLSTLYVSRIFRYVG